MDGGGIRGLVLIQMLEALETLLGGSVIQHFDWIAGTSTGGILSLALSCGKHLNVELPCYNPHIHILWILGKSIRECKSMYFRFKDQVFVGKRPYNADALETFLKNEFGNRTMADISGPKCVYYLEFIVIAFNLIFCQKFQSFSHCSDC